MFKRVTSTIIDVSQSIIIQFFSQFFNDSDSRTWTLEVASSVSFLREK